MNSVFEKLVNECEHLQHLSGVEKMHKPYEMIGYMLNNLPMEEIPVLKRQKLEEKDIRCPQNFCIASDEKTKTTKCIALKQLMQIVLDMDKNDVCSWRAIRDFWYRVHNRYKVESHADVEKVLNPLCKVLGFTGFENFLHKAFRPDVYNVVLLACNPDTESHRHTEKLLKERLAQIAGEKSNALNFRCRDIFSIASENKSMVQMRTEADILIIGDIENSVSRNAPFYMYNNRQSFFRTNYKRNEFIPFNFGDVARGYFPLNIDYIIYWCLAVHAYQNNNIISALVYIDHIITKLNYKNDQLYFMQGFLYHLENNKAMAMDSYYKAIDCNTKHLNSWLNNGIIYLLLQENVTAENCLRHFFELSNNRRNICYYTARLYLGILYKSLGRLEYATGQLHEVVSDLKPNKFAEENITMQDGNEILARAHMELAELFTNHPSKLIAEQTKDKVRMHLKEARRLTIDQKMLKEILKHLPENEVQRKDQLIKKHTIDYCMSD